MRMLRESADPGVLGKCPLNGMCEIWRLFWHPTNNVDALKLF